MNITNRASILLVAYLVIIPFYLSFYIVFTLREVCFNIFTIIWSNNSDKQNPPEKDAYYECKITPYQHGIFESEYVFT